MSSQESHNTKVTIKDSKSDVFDASIESDDEVFAAAVNHGVEAEGLDIGSIMKWSALGVAAVIIFIVALIPFSQYAFNAAEANVNVTSSYYEIKQLVEDADATLKSYGVVDGEAGIYRIPIDEAINKLATD